MLPTESGILLKNLVSCNFMLKYYITVSLWQFMLKYYSTVSLWKFTENLNQFFLSRANESLKICMYVWFMQLNQSSFAMLFLLENVLINGNYLKTTVCVDLRFIWLSSAMKHLLEKLHFESPHVLDIIKKLSLAGKIMLRFDIILHIWLIHMFFH